MTNRINLYYVLIFFAFHFSLFTPNAAAQKSMKDSSIAFPMIGASFQYQLPGGDMAKRFNNNYNVGAFFSYKFESNWIVGAEGNFLFAEEIKEKDILKNISTVDGEIINQEGAFSTILLLERGLLINVKAGRIFNLIGPNKNSGLLTSLGVGLLQHKIRIETKDNVPQLDDDYKKGYDRLSNGLALTEFIGYIHCGNQRLINFMIGLEFTQGFTANRRDFNFDTMTKDDKKRLDLLSGIKVAWFFPIYRHASTSFFYH